MLSQRLQATQLDQKQLPPVSVPFTEWRPDLSDYRNTGDTVVQNVIPHEDGYDPFPNIVSSSDAIAARCQGAVGAKDTSNNIYIYAGDATNLYRLTDQAFTDISGATYTTSATSTWEFAVFGTTLIATNYDDAVQSITVGGAGSFADLITSTAKPKAKHIDIVRDFVVLGNIDDSGAIPNRIWWSGINDATDFDPDATTQSDYQNIPTGGHVQKIVGGVEYGLVFMESQIWRLTYVGSPVVFQLDAIDRRRGTPVPNSVVAFGRLVFYISQEGFFVSDGVTSTPIGDDKVDETFWDQFDIANAHRVSAAVDPLTKSVLWLFPGEGNSGGTPNKMYLYKWTEQKWSELIVSDFTTAPEFLFWGGSQGFTLEGLDSVSASIDALTDSLDSAVWQGTEKLACFNTAKKMNLFTGSNLAATIETAEYSTGDRSMVRGVRPLVDVSSATVAVASRARLSDTATYGTAVAMTTSGDCYVLSEGAYHKVRLSIPAAADWEHAQGVEVEASRAGRW